MPTSPSRLSKGCAERQSDLEDDYHGKQGDATVAAILTNAKLSHAPHEYFTSVDNSVLDLSKLQDVQWTAFLLRNRFTPHSYEWRAP